MVLLNFLKFFKLRRLCSENNDLMSKLNEMENLFLVRDYDQEVIDKAKASVIGIKHFKEGCDKTIKSGCKKCFTCPHVFDDVHQVRWPTGVYSPKGNHSSISKDIIYCIQCLKCGSLYIGETERRLGEQNSGTFERHKM